MAPSKKETTNKKLRGGYYTPKKLTDFICNWAIDSASQKILEPSCGDGNFLESAVKKLETLDVSKSEISNRLLGIELIKEEASKARKRLKESEVAETVVKNSDFFHYAKSNGEIEYDVIIGNPPFIRYQSFPKEHRSLAMELMKDLGFKPNRLTNIWVPFLVASASMLSKNGKLGMVVPAELFQVKYAGETRVFLSNFFDRINIVTFKKLVFEGIQQEVVILLCEKSVSKGKGIRTIECENLDELEKIDFSRINGSNVKTIDHTSEKWTKYFLTEDEISLLRKLKNDDRVVPGYELMDVNVGIVTGRNKFFMLTKEEVEKWDLKDFTIPVVSRSNQLEGLVFLKKDFKNKSDNGQSIHLFLPPDEDFDKLPEECQRYIKYGESQGFHTGYKCRIRDRWYITPSLWTPDAFALRQISGFPKIILNKTNAASTDTVHRVKINSEVDPELLAISFMNSLSFAFSEITGRSYGGGVMTFEPTEMKDIRIPELTPLSVSFKELDALLRKRKISEVLDIVDQQLLIAHHGFSKDVVSSLRSIWTKLRNRRLNRR